MGISLIKKINEKTPYAIKKPFTKYIRGKLIENKIFQEYYNFLCDSEGWSNQQITEWQITKINELFQFARTNSEYYKSILSDEPIGSVEDIKNIEKLEKITLIEQLDLIASNTINDFYTVTTGGTSGKPTKIYMEKKAIYREWAFVYHYWSKFGYDYRTSKIATFRGVEMGNRISEINPLYQEIRMNPFIMNEHNFQDYLIHIENYGAEFLYGYPSIIYNFCRLSNKMGISLSGRFKAVFLISENLYPFQEEMITETLKCRIAMFYGHSERAVFAERYDSGYIFNPFYGVTEIDGEGNPIVTGFINYKTPLIRYLVDDKVEKKQNGNYNIIGHWDSEMLYGSNGERISMASINFHDDTFQNITGYQFVQNEIGKCIVRILSDHEIDDSRKKKISDRIQHKIGKGFLVNVCQVNSLQNTSRGKYKMLIQNVSLNK